MEAGSFDRTSIKPAHDYRIKSRRILKRTGCGYRKKLIRHDWNYGIKLSKIEME